jgi:hypothetical protein
MFTLPPASAKRIADSIRGEGDIIRLNIKAPPSMWALVDGKVTTGREILKLSSAPDTPALWALVQRICRKQPSLMNWGLPDRQRLRRLTRRERAFLTCVAREACALGLWFSLENPQTVVFFCAPNIHRVAIMYPQKVVEYVLARLDACSV